MKRRFILVPVLLIFSLVATAAIKLPAIISSGMVLQRDADVVLWGWTAPKETISVECSWLSESINVKANDSGAWHLTVRTTLSRDPQTIAFKERTTTLTLVDILFGEVWICSGQSNMQQPMNGYNGMPTYGGNMAAAKGKNPNLKLFFVDRIGAKTPVSDLIACSGWQEASPHSIPDFSAVAYYFGAQLQEILDVPVGLIHSSWGGSIIQAWMSEDVLSKYQEVNIEDVDVVHKGNRCPSSLFNSMINPIVPYTIKGALWYQGEANRAQPQKYKTLFPAMVKDWRDRWGQGEFPFYYVQIAPFFYNAPNAFNEVDNTAFIREIQLQCLDLIPNSGMAVTLDVGRKFCIHPPQKKEVAERLLFWALNKTYGFNNIDAESPIYGSSKVENGGMTLTFDKAETGLYAYDELTGFEIAGEDKVFYPAMAKIVKGTTIFVKSDKVKKPVAVRYAWTNWIQGTLYDSNLLPASSFRTDDWDDATQGK